MNMHKCMYSSGYMRKRNFTCGVPALGSLRAAPLNQNMRSPIAAQRHRAPVAKRQRARAMHPNSTACRSAREDLRRNLCGTTVGPVSSHMEAFTALQHVSGDFITLSGGERQRPERWCLSET